MGRNGFGKVGTGPGNIIRCPPTPLDIYRPQSKSRRAVFKNQLTISEVLRPSNQQVDRFCQDKDAQHCSR